jgi:enamine deaminase RidA (YjgF/YER057c/UK114 family)
MRKRLYSWQGQRFLYLGLEGEPGQPLERQADGLFVRAAMELESVGLELVNTVRTRVFGRSREARDAGSKARSQALTGVARAAGSSYVAPLFFSSTADVGLDLYAMATPVGNPPRRVTEYEPQENFIRHLQWGPLVFLPGMTCEEPGLGVQCRDILNRAGAALEEAGASFARVVRASFYLHRDADIQELLEHVTSLSDVSLENLEIERVEGYSRPGKLVEMEFTALKAGGGASSGR